MPHMNELESSLDPSKFVFIALDDEDAATVEKFLSKRNINAIVALDQQGETFSAYHVSSRPMTVVIDPRGNVALVTQPQELEHKVLLEISTAAHSVRASAASKQSGNASTAAHTVPNTSLPTMKDPNAVGVHDEDMALAEIILRRKRPEEKDHIISHSSDGQVAYVGFEAKTLLRMALQVSDKYIEYREDLPMGTFDLTMKPGAQDDSGTDSIMLSILQQGFGLDISQTARSEEVLILKRSPSEGFKAIESVDQAAVSSLQPRGAEIAFGNLSIRNIAGLIEARTGIHVLDETHISGKYDGVLHWSGSVDDIKDAALNDLGLVVERGWRDVPYYAVSKRKKVDH